MRAVAAAVLAAGRGVRLGGGDAKPLAQWRGRPLVAWALDAAETSGCAPVLLVVGYRAGDVRAAAAGRAGVEVLDNPDWAEGIAASLRTVLAVLGPRDGVDAVCIGLADQPRVGAAAYRRLVAAHHDGARFAVATYGGVRGNPVLLSRSLWGEAAVLEGDAGARVLMDRHPVVDVPCDGTGSPADVDTPEDLERLQEDQ